MTDNELLEKLYEGTLTSQEHELLDVRIAQSPEFAAEVQEFLTVVQLLHKEKHEDRTDSAFLENTREKVLALVATAGAAGIAGGGAAVQSGSTSILTAKFLQWAIVALGTLGAGGLVWNLVTDTPKPVVQEAPAARSLTPPAAEQPEEPSVEQSAPVAENTVQPPQEQEHSLPVRQTDVGPLASSSARHSVSSITDGGAGQPKQTEASLQSPDKSALADNSAQQPDDMMVADVQSSENYERELEHFNQRLRQLKALKDKQGQARVLVDIAGTERLMQQYESAVFHAEQSLQLWKQLGNDAGAASAYRVLGVSNRDAGDLRKAEEALSAGLGIAQGEAMKEQRGLLLGELAKVYEAQGNKRLAYEKMNAAVFLLRQVGSPLLSAWEAELKQMELSLK